jgi:pyridinium-3,5-bisthiocarboxylic acid mononucleotide nickel chelatase
VTRLHLLCDDGITGQLWLSALVAVGADVAGLQRAVDRARLPARLVVRRTEAREVLATSVTVEVAADAPRIDSPAALEDTIVTAGLAERAEQRALRMATVLCEAEAAVHGVPVEQVRFHELGRARTVVQMIAAVSALELLEVERITTSTVALGGGTVTIAHGRFPVPPPAVLELLRGFAVEGGPRCGELTTPSGAAVLAALADPATAIPPMRLAAAGRGAGGQGAEVRLLTALLGHDLDAAHGDGRATDGHAATACVRARRRPVTT